MEGRGSFAHIFLQRKEMRDLCKFWNSVSDRLYWQGELVIPYVWSSVIMTAPPLPLTALSEAQRAQATQRLAIIRSTLEDGVTRTRVASTHHISMSTVHQWMKQYREKGLASLADAKVRSDKGKSRRLPPEAITLIEGLALQNPPRSIAAIHRQICTIAEERRWKPPGYDRVCQIIKNLDPALVTPAHQSAAAYREECDLLYRREATHGNAIWQADVRRIGGRK
jgi:putative transposase